MACCIRQQKMKIGTSCAHSLGSQGLGSRCTSCKLPSDTGSRTGAGVARLTYTYKGRGNEQQGGVGHAGSLWSSRVLQFDE